MNPPFSLYNDDYFFTNGISNQLPPTSSSNSYGFISMNTPRLCLDPFLRRDGMERFRPLPDNACQLECCFQPRPTEQKLVLARQENLINEKFDIELRIMETQAESRQKRNLVEELDFNREKNKDLVCRYEKRLQELSATVAEWRTAESTLRKKCEQFVLENLDKQKKIMLERDQFKLRVEVLEKELEKLKSERID